MSYSPITSFRRPVDSVQMERRRAASANLSEASVDKWQILRELAAGRPTFGLSDRTLTVLQALLSFHPQAALGGDDLVVFPSNQAICDRLNGMPCSTMRRHLSTLVQKGLIDRRDSPNGKRFVRRERAGSEAFGFDLAPLVRRSAEICAAAERARIAKEKVLRLRREVSLMRRDLIGLIEYGARVRPHHTHWGEFDGLLQTIAAALRRTLTGDELERISYELQEALATVQTRVGSIDSKEVSTSGADSEQHYQNSKVETKILEPAKNTAKAADDTHPMAPRDLDVSAERRQLAVPLNLVLRVCNEIRTYISDRIKSWPDLVRAADTIRPMLGISPSAWKDAVEAMGPKEAAVVIVAMLERHEEIRSPGGYLRHLARRASAGEFSCGPMVMALSRRETT